jgi:predicted NUDIX family NTP pyrophosphohydrolase
MSRTVRSAGIALVRPTAAGNGHELLLVHPGGPFWRNKDTHGWSIPKGEVDDSPPTDSPLTEDPSADSPPTSGQPTDSPASGGPTAGDLEATARREFVEETGQAVPGGPLMALPELNLGSGKRLNAFLARGEIDADAIVSNHFEMEWPPRSGRMQSFPEVDRAAWFTLDAARDKLHKGQVGLVALVEAALGPPTMNSR